MAVGFVPNSLTIEPLTRYAAMVPTAWEVIT